MWKQIDQSKHQSWIRKKGRMKPLWITFIAGFVILFSFQNCQNPPHIDEMGAVAANGQLVSGGKITLSEHQLKGLQLISKFQETIVKNGTSFSVISDRGYDFSFDGSNLKKEFIASSELNAVSETFCLSDELKNELQSILVSASICEKSDQESAQREKICAAVMVPEYANLQTEADTYSLGSATDSCGTNSVDLCGSESDLLKGFTKHLDSQLQNLKCN